MAVALQMLSSNWSVANPVTLRSPPAYRRICPTYRGTLHDVWYDRDSPAIVMTVLVESLVLAEMATPDVLTTAVAPSLTSKPFACVRARRAMGRW